MMFFHTMVQSNQSLQFSRHFGFSQPLSTLYKFQNDVKQSFGINLKVNIDYRRHNALLGTRL